MVLIRFAECILEKYIMDRMGIMTLILAGSGVMAMGQERPNVVLIYADDLGFGDLSCYGATRVSTPNTDRLAREGVRFTNAHSAAATSTPSRYGLMTGEYPWRRQGTGVANGDEALIIQPGRGTLPQLFQQKGYRTGAVGKWHLGLGASRGTQDWNGRVAPGPKEVGFDYSFIMAATGDRVPTVYLREQQVVDLDPNDPIEISYSQNFSGEPTGKDNPELLTKLTPSHGHDMAVVNGISRIGYMRGGQTARWVDEDIADVITGEAVRFIRESAEGDQPFFLYFGTNDVHVPRYPHARFRGQTEMGHRGDAIVQFDWSVGEIIRALEESGELENTIIILTSDNGPVLDDGYNDDAKELALWHKPAGPFRGGKYSAFEGGTRVPFILRYPGKTGLELSEALITQMDLFATMAELLQAELPEGVAPDSQPQLSAWLGQDADGQDYIVTSAYTLSISTPEWKYILPVKGAKYNYEVDIELGRDEAEQLYDLRHDRSEYDNLADRAQYAEVKAQLRSLLEAEQSKGIGLPLK